jgi:serine phosphatase RsbU (regulator of sigma subunit)
MLATKAAEPNVELVCSEVWGGNQSIRTAVQLPGMRGIVYSLPADGSKGGDVCYLSACRAGMLSRICVADVVGHGEAVSTMSGWMHRVMRRTMNRHDPVRVFETINGLAYAKGFSALTTAVCLSYYSSRAEMRYCYAGHPQVFHFDVKQDRWFPLAIERKNSDAANLPFGVKERVRYDVASVRVGPGDRFVVFTDGVTEAPSPQRELFGVERLHDLLESHRGADHQEFGEMVLAALRKHTQTAALTHDDVSLVALEAGPKVRGPKLFHFLKNRIRKFRS